MSDGTWGPPAPPEGPPPPTDVVPMDAPPPRRSRAKVAVGLVGVAALVGAGVFAVSRLSSDEAGGAATPEEAAEALFTALDAEDILGTIDVLLPGERETMREPAERFFSELSRLEVFSEDADPSAVGGIDMNFEIGDIVVDATNVEDIVNVQVDGVAAVTVDGETLPIGDLILDNVEVDRSELDTESTSEEFSAPLTAVEEDGRWYLSAFYTVAETARRQASSEDPLLIPAEGVTPVGGDSPEDAMDNMVEAIEGLDVEAIIAALNPDEWGALQRYAPLFLADAEEALAETEELTISIDDPVYEVSGSGDTRSIVIAELHAELTADGETATVDYADGCVVIEADGESVDSCEIGDDMPEVDDMFEDPEPVQRFLDTAAAAFEDYENPGLIVEQVDGQWYFSPLATMSEQFFAFTGALDRAEVDELVDTGEAAAESAFDEVFGEFELDIATDEFDEGGSFDTVPFDTTPPDTLPTDSVDTIPPPGTIDIDATVPFDTLPTESIDGGSGFDSCYGEVDPGDAANCFADGIAAGAIDPVSVPVYMRHPECGLADAFWSGEYASLPDAEFTALIEPAAPCFQQLVADGELSDGDLPYELADPQCLEGRNWYLALGEDGGDEYFQRLLDCVSN